MTDGVYEISTKQRIDEEPDWAAIAAEMDALANAFTE